MPRNNSRDNTSTREISFQTTFTKYAEGSVLSCCGDTKVLCTASIIEGVPRFLKDSQQGWISAEYSMLPRSTHTRNDREASRGKQSGRTVEIQRLIGRSLRSCVDLEKLDGFTILLDCDVLQADGGTRTTAINGAVIALVQAIQKLQYQKKITTDPIKHLITATSLGLLNNKIYLDLDYNEDSKADVDCNIILTDKANIVEIQGTAENKTMTPEQLQQMIKIATESQKNLLTIMRKTLGMIE